MARVIENDTKKSPGNFKPYPRADKGTYLTELVGIEDYEDNVWVNGVKTDELATNLQFVFRAVKGISATSETLGSDNEVKVKASYKDDDGEDKFFEFRKRGVKALPYGNDKSNMTIFVDTLAGRGNQKHPAIAESERKFGLDIDGFIGNKYLVTVDKTEDQRPEKAGTFYNQVKTVDVFGSHPPKLEKVLLKTKPVPAAPVTQDDDAVLDDEVDAFA